MAITRGQVAGSGHGGAGGFGAQTATFASAVTSGQLLVCLWVGNSNTGNATCADNVNGAWTALAQQTPFAGSGRRMNWFYKLNSAAATAGSMVVTVTPVANAGNSEWMQIATYNGVGGYDSAVSAYSTWTGGSGAITQVSGVPTQTGDLILYGISSDAETTQAMTASGSMTAMVLDATSKSAGASPNFAMAFDELLGAGAGAVTGSMTMSAGGDDGGRWIIGFSPSTGSIITKTQTGIARLANTQTKTTTGISRLANTRTKTQTGISRIANLKTKTTTGISRLARTVTKTQTGISKLANSRTKTQTGISWIKTTVNKTQTGISRIANTRTKTQTGISRLAQNFSKTQTGISRLGQTGTKTQTGISAIIKTATKTQTGISRIASSRTKTQTGISRLSNRCTKNQTGIACLKQNIYRFSTPTEYDVVRRGPGPFWRSFKPQLTGVTVLKQSGTYRQVKYPTQREISAAEIAYIGGHVHDVSPTEAADLTAAGYTVEVIT